MSETNRDFNSISPSAEMLIRLKAFTTIPFAKKTAGLLIKDIATDFPLATSAGNPQFFRWLLHFENRYRTIDKLINQFSVTNLLELSSGFSSRGLNLCLSQPVHFTDTDLPDLIQEKQKLLQALLEGHEKEMKGVLQLLPLNVLDRDGFMKIVDQFPPGQILVLNEGLLPYLNVEEKTKLCSIIREALQRRGGYWITGDVYTQKEEKAEIPELAKAWREKHHIDQNKFVDFDDAEQFFAERGFTIQYRETWVFEQLSCLDLVPEKKQEVIEKLKNREPDRQTWCLRVSAG